MQNNPNFVNSSLNQQDQYNFPSHHQHQQQPANKMNKLLQRDLKDIIFNLNQPQIMQLFKSFQSDVGIMSTKNYSRTGIKCYSCTVRFDTFESRGYGKDENQALLNSIKNTLQSMISSNYRISAITRALKHTAQKIELESAQKANPSTNGNSSRKKRSTTTTSILTGQKLIQNPSSTSTSTKKNTSRKTQSVLNSSNFHGTKKQLYFNGNDVSNNMMQGKSNRDQVGCDEVAQNNQKNNENDWNKYDMTADLQNNLSVESMKKNGNKNKHTPAMILTGRSSSHKREESYSYSCTDDDHRAQRQRMDTLDRSFAKNIYDKSSIYSSSSSAFPSQNNQDNILLPTTTTERNQNNFMIASTSDKKDCNCIYFEVHQHSRQEVKSLNARMKLLEEQNQMLKDLLLKDFNSQHFRKNSRDKDRDREMGSGFISSSVDQTNKKLSCCSNSVSGSALGLTNLQIPGTMISSVSID